VVSNAVATLQNVPGVERIAASDGSVRIRVRGLELARESENQLLWTFDGCKPRPCSAADLEPLAREISLLRRHDTADRRNPLYLRDPELWLESQVRANIEHVDAQLLPAPIYGQVPGITGTTHGIIDLLACTRDARLVILELKASEDIHLPLQALDYWIRVKWHAARGDFGHCGYFPGTCLRTVAPRLLLIAPALQFHPSNETVLRFFSPEVAVERIGVGLEWQKKLKTTLRA
jgi:hypothetical protein